MVDVVYWGGTFAFALLIVWCIYTAWYSHYGRHDGIYGWKLPSWAGVTEGVHRGEYVPKSEWFRPRPRLPWKRGLQIEDGNLVWEGVTYIAPCTAENLGSAFITITPDAGVINIPAFTQGPDEDAAQEQRIRDIVNDELASTPVYSALRFEDYGRFGDSSFDRADPAPVCTVVEVECPEHWDEELWWLRGA